MSAQDIATAVKQDNPNNLRQSMWGSNTTGYKEIQATDEGYQKTYDMAALPYSGCGYKYYESSAAVTNYALITVGVSLRIQVYGIEIHSLDTVNKGIVRFQDSDNTAFYAGYLGTAPSAFGTQINFETTGNILKVTTSGATAIVVHYIVTGGI